MRVWFIPELKFLSLVREYMFSWKALTILTLFYYKFIPEIRYSVWYRTCITIIVSYVYNDYRYPILNIGIAYILMDYLDSLTKFAISDKYMDYWTLLLSVIENVIMDYYIPTLNYHVQWLSISDIEQRNHVLYMHTDYPVKILNNFKSSLSLLVIWSNCAVTADYHVL